METRSASRKKVSTKGPPPENDESETTVSSESDILFQSSDSSFADSQESFYSCDDDWDDEILLFYQTADNFKVEWEPASRFVTSSKISDFRQKSGLKKDLSELKTPSQFFELLLTPNFLEKICKWTNEFAEKNRPRKRRDSHQKAWIPLTIERLEAWIGFMLLTSMVRKPRLRDYWSSKRITDTPGMREIFSRDEFHDIKKISDSRME